MLPESFRCDLGGKRRMLHLRWRFEGEQLRRSTNRDNLYRRRSPPSSDLPEYLFLQSFLRTKPDVWSEGVRVGEDDEDRRQIQLDNVFELLRRDWNIVGLTQCHSEEVKITFFFIIDIDWFYQLQLTLNGIF